MDDANDTREASAAGPSGESLTRSLSWTALGELVFAATSLLVLVVLGKFASASSLGAYTLGLAIATPAIIFTNLHLRPAYVVEAPGRWAFGDYLALRTLSLPVMVVGVVLLTSWVGYRAEVLSVIFAVTLFRVAESISDIFLAAPQRAQRMQRIGVSRALRGALLLSGVCIGVFALHDAVMGIWIGALANLALTLSYDLRTLSRYGGYRPRFERAQLASLAWRTLPIGLAAGLLISGMSVPAYTIESVHDLTILGRFGALISIISIGGVVNVVVGNASIPRLAQSTRRGATGAEATAFAPLLTRLTGLVVGAHACIIAGTYLLGGVYLSMYGGEFGDLQTQLRLAAWVGLAAGLANLLSQTVTAMGRFAVQLFVNGLGLVLAGYFAIEWIPHDPLVGGLKVLLVLSAARGVAYLAVIIVARLGQGRALS